MSGRNPPDGTQLLAHFQVSLTRRVDFGVEIGYIGKAPIYLPFMAKSILFVDDDPDLREIVSDQLTASGYDVDAADDGEMAIDKLQEKQYEVVLLDITMPNKNGMDVLRFTKERGLGCKVIMLTGMVGLSVAIESIKLGAADYITKPYNMDYLLASIKRAIEK
jgi:DNA-binding response OmpR family regulator